ncbi:hypothetical protein GGI25_006131 [Coemansia spiralis]|uniref:MT0933-like antitoxin protein n=2 Tax=Coemansia TaxID=4863 RepID=A0A9W8G1Z7_9FUNG|nr:hypothetical protein EDC05_006105 [Coemansia umbellata]KAJ2618941.1 hypothetical protein GGI26_006226 [Coemansia sp. RSA 1358]KAJ2669484.1 hypothetical protein GGI25_006131 [Coemansia spiralis]
MSHAGEFFDNLKNKVESTLDKASRRLSHGKDQGKDAAGQGKDAANQAKDSTGNQAAQHGQDAAGQGRDAANQARDTAGQAAQHVQDSGINANPNVQPPSGNFR